MLDCLPAFHTFYLFLNTVPSASFIEVQKPYLLCLRTSIPLNTGILNSHNALQQTKAKHCCILTPNWLLQMHHRMMQEHMK